MRVSSRRKGAYLNLAISDLSHWHTGHSLWLTIGDLGNSVWLSVTHDRDSSRWCGWLTIGHLGGSRCTTTLGVDSLDEDLIALVASLVGIQVVEISAQALPPDGGAANSEGVVGAEREASGIDGTGLDWLIELELIIGSDVTCSTSLICEDTALEGECEDTRKLSLLRGLVFIASQLWKMNRTLALVETEETFMTWMLNVPGADYTRLERRRDWGRGGAYHFATFRCWLWGRDVCGDALGAGGSEGRAHKGEHSKGLHGVICTDRQIVSNSIQDSRQELLSESDSSCQRVYRTAV